MASPVNRPNQIAQAAREKVEKKLIMLLAVAVLAGFVASFAAVGFGRHLDNASLMKTGLYAAFGTLGAGAILTLPIHLYGKYIYNKKLKEVENVVD